MKIKTYDEFINESVLAQEEIDISQFPNPVTGALARIFKTKGTQDGEKTDDIVKTKEVSIRAKDLKPSQEAIYLSRALGMAIIGVEGGDLGAIISKDNYILDGHHRWAATMFNNPDAIVRGYQADLNIGDLIPVLRALGDAFGNTRRGEPKEGDINVFDATINDAMAAIKSGKNMDKKFFKQEDADKWLKEKGGEDSIQASLALIQSNPPPAGALDRKNMPVIDASKGQEKEASNLLNKGEIDVRAPYA